MSNQPRILAGVPAHAGFLFLERRSGVSAAAALDELAALSVSDDLAVGLGSPLLAALGAQIPGMRPLPRWPDSPVAIPSTPGDLFVMVAGDDPGAVLHRERALRAALPSLVVADRVAGFMHADSRDLSGYEDGTENPTGDKARQVALQAGMGPGLDGSSVVAVQRWVHDLDAFDALGRARQDAAIGRDRVSNEELADAPASAHVKRTAQEDFDPEAFVLRRSMPWRDHRGAGLVFVAFGASLDPFQALLHRMVGLDDGVVDALFSFTRPVTGATFWCPPLSEGRLDLRAVQSADD